MTWTEGQETDEWPGEQVDYGTSSYSAGGDNACRVCNEEGHFARDCPNKPERNNKCFKCNEEGHISRDCPNESSNSRACRNCQREGHIARDCPDGPTTNCRKCGEAGHWTRDCPSGLPDKCFNCYQEGHVSKDCPEERRERKPMKCHRCSEEGHRASECTNEPVARLDENGNPAPTPVTYIPSVSEVTDENFDMLHYNEADLSRFDTQLVTVSDPQFETPINSFEDAQFSENLMQKIYSKMRFVTPTPIQKYCIPIIMAGKDIIACSQTGSGKSAAFILPILQHLLNDPELPPREAIRGQRNQKPLVVVVSPTRELCLQLYDHFRLFSEENPRRIGVSPAYGGTQVRYNAEQIRSGTHVLCAVPGRLQQFVNDGTISFENVRYLVLDEADRMLDDGFSDAIRAIVEHPTMAPKECRQTLMFSATFSEVEELARQMMRPDTVKVVVGILGGVNSDVIQQFVETPDVKSKKDALKSILDELFSMDTGETRPKVIVFVEKKKFADMFASFIIQLGYSATSIHGDRDQRQREEALRTFREGQVSVLVASEVAGRGLDIKGVGMVINFDMPQDIDKFVHRVGRTGRVGTQGRAISFFAESRDSPLAPQLVKLLNECGQEVPDFISRAATGGFGDECAGTTGEEASEWESGWGNE